MRIRSSALKHFGSCGGSPARTIDFQALRPTLFALNFFSSTTWSRQISKIPKLITRFTALSFNI